MAQRDQQTGFFSRIFGTVTNWFSPTAMPAASDVVPAIATKDYHPVTIVGGGISGLTALLRNLENGIPTVLYQDKNSGGLIRSTRPAGAAPLDMGGEFIDSGHKDIIALCAELGVPLVDSEAAGPNSDRKFYHYTSDKMLDNKALYDGNSGSGLFKDLSQLIRADQQAMRTKDGEWTPFARELDGLSAEEYLLLKKQQIETNGAKLPDALMPLLSHAYTCENGRDLKDMSALAFVEPIGTAPHEDFALFGASDERYKVAGGTAALIEAMVAKIHALAAKQGIADPIRTQHRLTGVEAAPGGLHRLHFTLPDGSMKHVTTDYVISALQAPVLASIPGAEHLGLTPQEIETAAALQYTKSSKIFVEVKGMPWADFITPEGQHITDSNGQFGGKVFQSVWPSGAGDETQAGNHWITFLVGGDVNDQMKPAELVEACKGEYAHMLGKSPHDIFTGQQQMLSAHKQAERGAGGCYLSPDRNQYLPAVALSRSLASKEGDVGFAGGWMIQEVAGNEQSDPVAWVGFMQSGVHSAEMASAKCVERMQSKQADMEAAQMGLGKHAQALLGRGGGLAPQMAM